MRFDRSVELGKRAHELIPGGAHTYAKGDDQYPEDAPPRFIERGSGAHVWDVDGNEFIEYGMGLRSVTLGHGYGPVVEAAVRDDAATAPTSCAPRPLELEWRSSFSRVLPAADMVKFAKNGSDVTTAAVKLASAFTGRDLRRDLRAISRFFVHRRLVHRHDPDGPRHPGRSRALSLRVPTTTTSTTWTRLSPRTPDESPA